MFNSAGVNLVRERGWTRGEGLVATGSIVNKATIKQVDENENEINVEKSIVESV